MKPTRDTASWSRFFRRSQRAGGPRARASRWLGFERLEDRILLSHDTPDVLSVGRTLSSWSLADIRDRELTITYSVYNQQTESVSGVLLTDTLQAGVTFKSASALPDRNGQEMAWSLGTLEPFGRASVSLTVHLDSSNPLTLDTGAQAFGTLQASMVTDAAPPATLRADAIAQELLASTPDANTNDPFIQAKAAELDYDPQRIFDFLRLDVGYESYTGSLRGARGTLWSSAGNSLDEASLMVALLRGSGVPARYVQGILPDNLAQLQILSMFPEPLRVVGCLEPGTELADPANDPKLLAETRQHFWVEFNVGGGFVAADPTFTDAAVGQVFTTVQSTFAGIPDDLNHQVTIRLKRELTLPAAGLFGAPAQGIATVLDETFNTVELVGKPLSIAHFVDTQALGALFTSVTNTYTPYLVFGDFDAALEQTRLITGTPYQEVMTNFPLGSQIVTGLFLEMDVSGPDGATETFERTLIDRIGLEARQHGGTLSVTVDPDGLPFVTSLDVFTLQVLPGLNTPTSLAMIPAVLNQLSPELAELATIDPSSFAASKIEQFLNEYLVALTRVFATGFLPFSDELTAQLAERALVKAYFDRPRLVLVSHRVLVDPATQTLNSFVQIDLRRDSIRSIPLPGQNRDAARAFQAVRGVAESVAERDALSFLLFLTDNNSATLSAASVLEAAAVQSIDLNVIGAENYALLDGLNIPAEAMHRITRSVQRGDVVIVPSRAVEINGGSTIAWYQINTTTGEVIGVSEDGGHAASSSEGAGANAALFKYLTYFAATVLVLAAVDIAGSAAITAFFCSLYAFRPPPIYGDYDEFAKCMKDALTATKTKLEERLGNYADVLKILKDFADDSYGRAKALFRNPIRPGPRASNSSVAQAHFQAVPQFLESLPDASESSSGGSSQGNDFGSLLERVLAVPLAELMGLEEGHAFLFSPEPSGLFDDLTGVGVASRIIPDPEFTPRAGSAQLPTAFRVGIRNLGAQTDTFDLQFTDVPAGFAAHTSVSRITIPAGQIAEVGICLKPPGEIPPPETPASFSLKVASTTNSSVSTTDTESFTLPDVHGVSLASNPTTVSVAPGTPASMVLTVEAVGNVAENVVVEIFLPTGLSASSLDPIPLAPGETATRTLVLTPGADVSLNSTLTATILADFGGPEPEVISIPIRVAVPGADAIANAATDAEALGNTALANRLNDLSIALTNLVQNPANDVFKGQALASLDSAIAQLTTDPLLAPFTESLTATRGPLVNATTPAEVQASVTTLGNALDTFATFLSNLAKHRFDLALSVNSQVAQPQVPVNFPLLIRNTGTESTTYNLSVLSLPTGVTGTFNVSSVTLTPGQFTSAQEVFLTLTSTSTTELSVFGFEVKATVEGAPDVSRTAAGSLTARREVVSVVSVTTDPPFVEPGGIANVSARVLNAVNREQQALASFVVKNAAGQAVFTSPTTTVTLGVLTSLISVDLGSLNSEGLARGDYTIEVHLSTLDGQPIPGATGEGRLLVGSPLTVGQSVVDSTLPPGTSTVRTTLQIGSTIPVGDPLSLVGFLPVDDPNVETDFNADILNGVALNGNVIYVFGDGGIHVVDVADLAHPRRRTTIRDGGLFFGGRRTHGEVVGDRLFTVDAGTFSNVAVLNNSTVSNSSLGGAFGGSPQRPVQIDAVDANHLFITDFVVSPDRTHLFASLHSINFTEPAHEIFSQSGTVIAFDVSNPADLRFTSPNSILLNENGAQAEPPLFIDGGNFNMSDIEQPNATTLLVASTTSTGAATQTGVGRLLVIDVSDPDNINSDAPNPSKIVNTLDIPGTVLTFGLALDGNLALVVGSEGGYRNPFPGTIVAGPTGNLVLATVDISDPRNPRLLHTQVLNRAAEGGLGGRAAVIPLGNKRFAFANPGTPADTPQLFIVDASDLNNLRIVEQRDVSSPISGLKTDGTFLYVTAADGLTIYRLGGNGDIPFTAEVRVPDNTGVAVVPDSFNVAPSRVIDGADFDTYVFDLSLTGPSPARTISWQSTVADLQPGESRAVTLGTTVAFTSQGTPGQASLPALEVVSEQIVRLAPAARAVRPGEAALFAINVSNPTGAPVIYSLSLHGAPATWSNLPLSVTVPAGEAANVPFTLTSEAVAPVGDYGFVVSATAGGTVGSVQGTLTLAGDLVLPSPESRGVVVTLTPTQATAGQGTFATYVVRVTNTGSATDTFTLATDLASDFTPTLERTTLEVPPGVGNFREVRLLVTPRVGTAVGTTAFQVTAVSATRAEVNDRTSGTIAVASVGVAVQITPEIGDPGSTFSLTVTNTGQATDTFDLELAGPTALVSTLDATSVTLEPNQSQTVTISVDAIDFAIPGTLALVGRARSRTNQTVSAAARAEVRLASTHGLTVEFPQDTVTLNQPGPASFLLMVNNTGNTEDEYTATITGTEGPITASLLGLDGQPTQTVTPFRLPGLSTGAILLRTNQTIAGQGTVTVEVRSRTNGTRFAFDSAVVMTGHGQVSGTLFLDYSADGTPDADEPVLADRTVFLDSNGDGVLTPGEPTVVTDAAGRYHFRDLAPGAYAVRQAYRPNHGVVLTGTGRSGHSFTLTAGTEMNDRGFGNVFISPVSPVGVAADIAAGTEETATMFVRQLYRNVLERDPDTAGLAFWTDHLRADGNSTRMRETVASGLWRSAEHRGVQVDHYFRTFLDREADAEGRDFWVSRLMEGIGEVEAVLSFLTSAEYQAAHADAAALVRGLYEDVLSREADDTGLLFWQDTLATTGLRTVAQAIVQSEESYQRIVAGYYAALLHRPGEALGRQFWTHALREGRITAEAAGESFLFADEYFERLEQSP